jgi:DNA polymerase-1
MKSEGRMLIIDQLNLFFRNYIVNPSLSLQGQPIGGLRGCIQSLQKLVRETSPDVIIICWDGAGGSKKRKLLQKDYKAGRKPIRLNRAVKNLSEQQEVENKVWQQMRLVDYYNQLPVLQFMFDSTEADDIIAYVSQTPRFKNWQKIIVSSDKDFFQLLNENTVLLRPIQKEVLNKNSILEKFNIHPTNFAMARALVGDKSDNIQGIPGLGLKTVAKRFPIFQNQESVTFSSLMDYCKQQMEESTVKAYRSVVENEDLIRNNYHMMQLYTPIMSIQAKNVVHETLANPDMSFNKTGLTKLMMQDGFGETNFVDLFAHCKKISVYSK